MSYTLNAEVIDTLSESRFSRAVWVDAEPVAPVAEGEPVKQWELVIRGWDKTLSGAKPSEAKDAMDQKEHKPALYWNDEAAKHKRYVIATFDNADDAETCAVQLTEFYDSADDEAATFAVRFGAMGNVARELLPVLVAQFGLIPTKEQLKYAGRIGSFAEFNAEKETPRKPKVTKKAQREAELIEEGKKQALAELAAKLNNREALAKMLGVANVAPDMQSQLESVLTQLQQLAAQPVG